MHSTYYQRIDRQAWGTDCRIAGGKEEVDQAQPEMYWGMVDYIKCKDLEIILRYARIYGLANKRRDILAKCRFFSQKLNGRSPHEKIRLDTKSGGDFGKLCVYAVASAGSCGEAGKDVCRIAREHSGLMSQYDRASAMAVADMLKDTHKGEDCPFYILYKYLEKEGTGETARTT